MPARSPTSDADKGYTAPGLHDARLRRRRTDWVGRMVRVSSRRDVVILGSTGSIGTQALDVVRANPDRFRVVGLTAGGSQPDAVRGAGRRVRARRSPGSARRRPSRRPAMACDVVLNGITGAVGLRPDAGRAGRRQHAGAGQQGVADHRRPAWSPRAPSPGQIVPVDSEHSALAQCLRGGAPTRYDGWC